MIGLGNVFLVHIASQSSYDSSHFRLATFLSRFCCPAKQQCCVCVVLCCVVLAALVWGEVTHSTPLHCTITGRLSDSDQAGGRQHLPDHHGFSGPSCRTLENSVYPCWISIFVFSDKSEWRQV